MYKSLLLVALSVGGSALLSMSPAAKPSLRKASHPRMSLSQFYGKSLEAISVESPVRHLIEKILKRQRSRRIAIKDWDAIFTSVRDEKIKLLAQTVLEQNTLSEATIFVQGTMFALFHVRDAIRVLKETTEAAVAVRVEITQEMKVANFFEACLKSYCALLELQDDSFLRIEISALGNAEGPCAAILKVGGLRSEVDASM